MTIKIEKGVPMPLGAVNVAQGVRKFRLDSPTAVIDPPVTTIPVVGATTYVP